MTDTFKPEFDAMLRDGRSVHVRPIHLTDEAELLQAFERLSPDARYMRFMRPVRELNMDRARRRLAALVESGVGIVATVPAEDGLDIVGTALCVVGTDPMCGEFAITVAGNYAGAGLGKTLMRTLIERAHRRGLQEMEGFVLSANTPMLRLASSLGFSVARDPEDPSVKVCKLRLADA